MKITKVQLYLLFGFSILLTLLNINSFFNILGLFITCFIISYNCFKDIVKSIKYGLFLLVVLSLVGILLKITRNNLDGIEKKTEKIGGFEKYSKKFNKKETQISNYNKPNNQHFERLRLRSLDRMPACRGQWIGSL